MNTVGYSDEGIHILYKGKIVSRILNGKNLLFTIDDNFLEFNWLIVKSMRGTIRGVDMVLQSKYYCLEDGKKKYSTHNVAIVENALCYDGQFGSPEESIQPKDILGS